MTGARPLASGDEGKLATVRFHAEQMVGGDLVLAVTGRVYRVDPDVIWLDPGDDAPLLTVVPADVESWTWHRRKVSTDNPPTSPDAEP